MPDNTTKSIALEQFDDYWGILGEPAAVEKKLMELLPEAAQLSNNSVYLQILSQIALAQALQKNFTAAHATLEKATAALRPQDYLAETRIVLERGRVLQQEGNVAAARENFEKAFTVAQAHGLDFHAVNAAHMIAIIAASPDEKIIWNLRAIELAEKSSSDGKKWLGSLYHNLGQNYVEAQQLDKALSILEKALKLRQAERYRPNIFVTEWALARCLRLNGEIGRALPIIERLQQAYDAMEQSNTIELPQQMFILVRGMVYEEFAEIYATLTQKYASMAHDALSNDAMFCSTEPDRIKRLSKLAHGA